MNTKNITVAVLLIIDVLLCVLCVWAFRQSGKPVVDKQLSDRMHKISYLESCIGYNIENNDLTLDGETMLNGQNGNKILLKDLVADSTKLFYRISELHCEECVRFFLLKLIRLSDVKGWSNDQIVILGSYQNARSLFIYTEQLGVRFPVYNMEPLDLPAEKLSAPYCFITDGSLQVMHFFVPDKYVGEISNYYLDLVANRYFKPATLEFPEFPATPEIPEIPQNDTIVKP